MTTLPTSLSNLNLTTFNKIYPLLVQKYSTLIPDPNANTLDKINSIIDSLNSVGKVSNDVIDNWNKVMAWVMSDGLTTDVSNKLDAMVTAGTFDQIFQKDIAPSLGDITTLQTTDKSNLTNALNEVDQLAKSNQTNVGTLSSLSTGAKNNLVAAINENQGKIAANTASLADIALDIRNYGFVGDGVNDDAISIQNAVNYATSLIQQKSSGTDVFAGQVTIQLPPKKIFIKSKINVNNAIVIQGHGTASTLVLNANLDYIFDFNKNLSGCVTMNEESQMEGGGLRNLRISGNKRGYTLTSAVRFYNVDHALVDSVYFYAIKGKCIELKTARECNFDNLFTRFCGTTTQGNIEIVAEDTGADTSNLNFGTNWNIVFPYGSALKIVNTTAGSINFTNIDGLLVHGIFSTIYNNLVTNFGTNSDYAISSGANQIDVTNGEIRLTGAFMVYAPNLTSYVKLNNSVCRISSSMLQAHYNNNETHGSGDYWFYLSNTSILYIGGAVVCKMATQNGDTFYIDGTSYVYGAIEDVTSAQWLNGTVTKKVGASEIDLLSDTTSPVTIKPRSSQSAVVNSYGRMMYQIMTASDLNTPIMQMGVNSGITTPVNVLYGNTFINNLFIGTVSSLPTAGSAYENQMAILQGNGTSTADILYVCLKSATGTYSWKQVVSG